MRVRCFLGAASVAHSQPFIHPRRVYFETRMRPTEDTGPLFPPASLKTRGRTEARDVQRGRGGATPALRVLIILNEVGQRSGCRRERN